MLAVFSLASAAATQGRVHLPTLTVLGPVPVAARVTLHADGRLGLDEAAPVGLDARREVVARAAAAGDLVLWADRTAPAAAVCAVVATARAQRLGVVHFVATLPDGRLGAFTLSLPRVENAGSTFELTLHRERGGVPPTSVTPLLRRLAQGSDLLTTIGVDTSGDAAYGQVLRVLAAVAAADVARVILTCRDRRAPATFGPVADAASLAIDLGPYPSLQVRGEVVAQPAPRLLEAPVGCLLPPPSKWTARPWPMITNTVRDAELQRVLTQRPHAGAVARGAGWIWRQQATDGSWVDEEGRTNLDATLLVFLARATEGRALELEPGAAGIALRRSLGFVLGQQRADGCFGDGSPGCVRRHALAVWGLARAAREAQWSRGVFMGSLAAGVEWLDAQRRPDGGFNEGGVDTPSDAVSTALAAIACEQAMACGVPGDAGAEWRTIAWFDRVRGPGGVHRMFAAGADEGGALATAAAICGRLAAGQTQGDPALAGADEFLLQNADARDPWNAWWVTQALRLWGGGPWDRWSKVVQAEVVATQLGDGEHQGTWEPAGARSRLVTTALRALTLDTYHRYLGILR